MTELCFKVVIAYIAGELNFLNFNNLLFFSCFFFAFFAFKTEFAVIHYATHGRFRLVCYHNKVAAAVIGGFKRLVRIDNTELFAVFADETHLRNSYILVEKIIFSADSSTPPKIKIAESQRASPHRKFSSQRKEKRMLLTKLATRLGESGERFSLFC